MSVVIIGGNDRMERLYVDTCKSYGCKAKVFIKNNGKMRNKIGSPDLVIVFTDTVSHKMAKGVVDEAKKCCAKVEHCHSASLSSLKSVLAAQGLEGRCS